MPLRGGIGCVCPSDFEHVAADYFRACYLARRVWRAEVTENTGPLQGLADPDFVQILVMAIRILRYSLMPGFGNRGRETSETGVLGVLLCL